MDMRSIRIVPRLLGVMLIVTIIVGGFASWLIQGGISDSLSTAENRELTQLYRRLIGQIDGLGEQALASASLVAGLPQVHEAMRKGDRQSLAERFVPGFELLKSDHRVRQFQFHLPPATSFLRVHKPGKFGDDLSSFRHTVVATNTRKVRVKGLEIGVAGLGVRGVVPVSDAQGHIGSVEFGLSFGQAFFDEFGEEGVHLALYLVRDGEVEQFASTFPDNYRLDAQIVRQVAQGQALHRVVEHGESQHGHFADVVRDYAGKVIGVLEVSKDRSFYTQQLSDTLTTVVVSGLAAIVLIVLAMYFVGRNIVRPINDATGIMREIAEGNGDLDVALDASGNDEISELAGYFNGFVGTLRTLVTQVQQSSTQIDTVVGELADSTEQTRRRVTDQQQHTLQIATAMNQMSTTVLEVAQQTAEVAKTADGANDRVRQGNSTVLEAANSVDQLAGEIASAVETVQKVTGDSERIGTVLEVIRGIAEQTNLLALNAAIEAARAGDQGRGFAVVADEVRQLAYRTQQSTTEIQEMVESLQSSVEETVGAMARSRERADETVTHTRQVNSELDQITQHVDTISQMTTQIATAAEQQSKVAEEINTSVNKINQAGDDNSAQIARFAESTQQLSSNVDGLVAQISRFRTGS